MPGMAIGLGSVLGKLKVAAEAMLVGSIGLIAAVPLTTALATLLAVRLSPGSIEDDQHLHAH
jgi:hypothetical protein